MRKTKIKELSFVLTIVFYLVIRAYRELEIEGILDTQQGSGTFVSKCRPDVGKLERQRMLDQILTDMLARASSYGFMLDEVLEVLRQPKEETK